jgi:hypothetical protein
MERGVGEQDVEGQGAEDQGGGRKLAKPKAFQAKTKTKQTEAGLTWLSPFCEGCGELRKSSKGMKFYSKRELCSLPNYKTLARRRRGKACNNGSQTFQAL